MRSRPAVWAGIPLGLGALALTDSLVGLAWDVAYHIDHGRDSRLFTIPHLMTLTGLAGFGLAGALAVVLARRAGRPVPKAAVPIVLLSLGSTVGFPLDDLWHRVYGVDVTLWSPTHLVMIGGAILSTFGFALLAAEGSGGRLPRGWLGTLVMTGPLLGLSVLQFEWDFGVPQWQALLQPVLIAATAGLCLCAARVALGPGGAIRVAAVFLGFRLVLGLFIAALGHTVPATPLYLVSAAAVEAAFLLEARWGLGGAAALAGVAIGTAGIAAEWAWSALLSPLPWQTSLLPGLWDAGLAAVAGAMIGAAAGSVLAGRRVLPPIPVLAVAGLGLAAALALPLPRTGLPASATITATSVGAPRVEIDRFGRPGLAQPERIEVALAPDVASGADWAVVMAWQGGGRQVVPLVAEGGGRYHTATPVETGAGWKTMLYVARGAQLGAAAISFPSDVEYGTQGTPLEPVRTARLQAAPALLMSESHSGPGWVATAAYTTLWLVTAAWIALLLNAYRMAAEPAPGPLAEDRAAAPAA